MPLIHQLSSITPLLPGDLIFTGTRSGVGGARTPPQFLTAGDELVSTIDGIGSITTTSLVPSMKGAGAPDHVDLFRLRGHDGDMTEIASTGLQLRSLVEADGTLHLSLQSVDVPPPGDGEVLVRVDAAPINPSDLGLLFGGADMAAAIVRRFGRGLDRDGADLARGAAKRWPVASASRCPSATRAPASSLPPARRRRAQALLGKTVGLLGGAMYSQYRCVDVSQCLELPAGVTAVEGAACFVNPLTVLGQVGTMRREGHTALVHTAAASNLGQMLNRLCIADGIPLVNIVRSSEHVSSCCVRRRRARLQLDRPIPSWTT